MSLSPDYWWKVVLELKLRKVSGDAFQGFFSDVMQNYHGDDFVKVRPFGSKGDKGCDGFVQSTGQVFQCYGALNGDGGKVAYLVSKIKEDFAKAREKLSKVMKEWHMVHNLVDGLPIEAVEVLKELENENPEVKFGFIGMEGIGEYISQLDMVQVESLLGPVATNSDARNLQVDELRELVGAVAKAAESLPVPGAPIEPVPVDKLDANNLPGHWQCLIAGGWQNAHLVSSYFDRHPEPLFGEKVSRLFSDRYQYLKAQRLQPGTIMNSLYEFVTGVGTVSPERQVAAQALLAYLFESCDIFENSTVGETA